MSKTIEVRAEIVVPRTPNFVQYAGGTIPIHELSDAELRRIGEAWTEQLLGEAQAIRKRRRQ